MLKKGSLAQKIFLIFFGLFLTLVILEIGLRIAGFTILAFQEHRNLQSIKQKGSFRIMCLGESTTQGQYPPYLEEILNQSNTGIKSSVIDEGVAGIITTAILDRLESDLDKYKPDIVVAMMGINDSGSYLPYDITSTAKITSTLHFFKVYKLIRLIQLNISAKLKEVSKKQKSIQQEQPSRIAIEPNLDNDTTYIELGVFYRNQERFTESREAFKKAIELNPNNYSAYIELGWLYIAQRKYIESEQAFKKAIELNSNNDSAFFGLGRFYQNQGKYAESEQAFKKAIELNPKNDWGYIGLSWLYISQRKFSEAEQLLKKALGLNPNSNRMIRNLAIIYYGIGNSKLYEIYTKKAESLKDEYPNSVTVNNYRTLKQILDKRKIQLVSVQYPVRSLGSLKKIFQKDLDNIIFVDNEKIFKDAIREKDYNEYFTDMFGGDFGHCTPKGNRLLAENIANVILKEYFNK